MPIMHHESTTARMETVANACEKIDRPLLSRCYQKAFATSVTLSYHTLIVLTVKPINLQSPIQDSLVFRNWTLWTLHTVCSLLANWIVVFASAEQRLTPYDWRNVMGSSRETANGKAASHAGGCSFVDRGRCEERAN